MTNKKLALALTVSLLTVAFLSNALPPTSANPSYTIRFDTEGFTGYTSNIITIDGTSYTVSDLSWKTFSWKSASTHTITAVSSFQNTEYPTKTFDFAGWTHGNGLVAASGTFNTPSHDTTVTLNYALATHIATFAFEGITSYSSQIVVIDSVAYPLSDFTWRTFAWNTGTVHTVQAITPITNTEYPAKTFAFQSWTGGGSDLTAESGTITMPANDISVTATYGSPTHIATFAIAGTTSYTSNILKIDDTTYTVSQLNSHTFAWDAGTTHTVEAIQTVKNTDSPAKYYNFSSWTNGNGLTDLTGTFTMPSTDVTVTATYAHSSAHVSFATSGLNNINNGITVLTVDGQTYDVYNVQNINAVLPEWNITQTHTVTAAPTVTGWDSATYYFQDWTNGNGLVSNSGTITTPASDVTVTANYAATQPQSQEATTLTIMCNPLDQNNVTRVTGFLTNGDSGVNGKTVTLSYFNGATWVPIASTTTAADGNYTYEWTIPSDLPNTQYPVQAVFSGDSSYEGSTATTGSPGNGANLTVLPESTIGSIVALLACFAGALVFLRVRAKRATKK